MTEQAGVRIRLDKWLWAARFFKTRSLAAAAISGGKVHVNEQRVKPARAVTIGDRLQIRRGFDTFEIVVDALSDQRGPARIAQTLYTETEAGRQAREAAAEQRRYERLGVRVDAHRPSSRERRQARRIQGKD